MGIQGFLQVTDAPQDLLRLPVIIPETGVDGLLLQDRDLLADPL
jgi:hypothetical protein